MPPESFMKLLQVDDTEVINFLLSTEIIPLCLRTMEMGSELSKTVATFIVQKILLDNVSSTPSDLFPLEHSSAAALAIHVSCMHLSPRLGLQLEHLPE